MVALGFIVFTVLIVILELWLGCAVIGWSGDNMVVERERNPGPYWFAISLHCLTGVALPLLFHFSA
ncbi:MAG: hypothetical protein JNL67_09915 [Planctomycetaceae bacterium]|nr:hypothetical protein [Planctomycetaceae bacterium]